MKATTLRMLVGVTTPLILTGSVQAGFTGISTTSKPNPFGLLVVNLYAEFDRPGEDHMLAVAGTANAPLLIQVLGGGTFFNATGGTDQPPNCFFPCNLPSLAFDTFVTIGVKAVGFGAGKQPEDHMVLTSEWPGFGTSTLETSNAGWEITQLDAQGDPFNPDFFAGDGRVLIGQFSTLDGTGIEGTMLLQYISNGVVGQSVASFFHVPGPGALWLLAAAGLLGRRRRR